MTFVQGIYVPADEATPMGLVDVDETNWRSMQQWTSDGDFQMLDCFRPNFSMFFNEEGKIHGLPLNRRASLLLWTHRTEFRGHDAILGDALLLGPADEETGDSMRAPEELVELLFRTESYKYQVKTIGESGWHGNGRTFDSWVEAYNNALALAERWTLVEHVKVVAA